MSKVLVDRELLPCPFCGQQDAFVEQLDSDASVVICQGMVDEHSACLARGPVGVQQSDMEEQPGRDAAVAEWNRRAQPAEAEGVEVVAAFVYDNDMLLCVEFDPKARMGTADGTALVRQSDHLAALSAVAAERDAANSRLHEVAVACATAEQERDQLRAEVEALRKDASRLDRLDIECEAYGCEGIHEGNRWMIDGPFRTVRDAIDAAMAAKEA